MSDAFWSLAVVVLALVGSTCWVRLKLRMRFPEAYRAVTRLTGRSAPSLLAACGLRRPGIRPHWWASLVGGVPPDLPVIISATPTAAGADVLVHPAVGQEPHAVAQAAERLGAALGVPIVGRSLPAGSVVWSLRAVDPLADWRLRQGLSRLGGPPGLFLGATEECDDLVLDLSNVSGVVVAGVPGSGKTAALTRWVAELAASHPLALMVIDGKGGGDYLGFSDRSTLLVDGRLDPAVGVLEAAVEIMEYRLANSAQLNGGPQNYWDADPEVRPPLLLLLIDEAQTVFSPAGTKEEKAMSVKAVALVADLVRRGRSCGIVTIASTQRATVDAIPGQIRDNSGARLSFRVTTSEAARAVLGAEFDPAVSPIGAPTGVGVAVADGMPATRFRTPYATPREIAEFVVAQGGPRIELADLAPGLAYDVPLAGSAGQEG